MESVLTKSEKIIAIIVLLVISLFFITFYGVSFKTKTTTTQFETGSGINYTMARPEAAFSEYTLDGREQEYTFEGAPNIRKKNKQTTSPADKKNRSDAGKTVETKKQELAKKQQAEAAKAQAQSKQLEEKKSLPSATEVALNESNLVNDDSGAINSRNKSAGVQTFENQAKLPEKNPDDAVVPHVNTQDPNLSKKSFAQWRATLFSNPTPDTLALFLAALRKNELTEAEYQVMAQDLVAQKDLKLKGLGLMALRASPSLASLTQLVHIEPAKLDNYQLYVEHSLNAYAQPQNLQFLNQALLTKDKKLIIKSLALLNFNLTKFSQGDLTDLHDSRGIRSGEVVKFSMENYKSLLPALTQLSISTDPELSGLAQQTAALIQSSNTIAQN